MSAVAARSYDLAPFWVDSRSSSGGTDVLGQPGTCSSVSSSCFCHLSHEEGHRGCRWSLGGGFRPGQERGALTCFLIPSQSRVFTKFCISKLQQLCLGNRLTLAPAHFLSSSHKQPGEGMDPRRNLPQGSNGGLEHASFNAATCP